MQNPFSLCSIFFIIYKFPIDGGEVAGVVIIGRVGHVPPESFEVFAQTLVFEDMAAVGKWQVADDALTVETRLEIGIEVVDIGEGKTGIIVCGIFAAFVFVKIVVIIYVVSLSGVYEPQGQFAIAVFF